MFSAAIVILGLARHAQIFGVLEAQDREDFLSEVRARSLVSKPQNALNALWCTWVSEGTVRRANKRSRGERHTANNPFAVSHGRLQGAFIAMVALQPDAGAAADTRQAEDAAGDPPLPAAPPPPPPAVPPAAPAVVLRVEVATKGQARLVTWSVIMVNM